MIILTGSRTQTLRRKETIRLHESLHRRPFHDCSLCIRSSQFIQECKCQQVSSKQIFKNKTISIAEIEPPGHLLPPVLRAVLHDDHRHVLRRPPLGAAV